MNEPTPDHRESRSVERGRIALSRIALFVLVLGAGLVGGLISRLTLSGSHPRAQSPTRPIVQIVRQQPGFPSLADAISALCPSTGVIVPRNLERPFVGADRNAAPSTVYPAGLGVSGDGWLITSASIADAPALDVVFGDGRRAPVLEIRRDLVSGLAIVKIEGLLIQPVVLNDQAAGRVGDFGFGLHTQGSGCSAQAAMIGGDFLTDGGGPNGYLRIQPGSGDWPDGTPFFSSDGRLIGVANDSNAGELVPSPVVAVITDELIRNSLSPTTQFGFRAIDFAEALSTRLGDFRSRGAGIALVQAKSAAARAGLLAGDIVVAVNGSPVSSASELGRALDGAGTTTSLKVKRGADELDLTIVRR